MIHNPDIPEVPNQLSPKSERNIERRLSKALGRVARLATNKGGMRNYYKYARRRLNSNLTAEIRALVSTAFPATETQQAAGSLHAYALALEMGLTIGSAVAREALDNDYEPLFANRMAANLKALRDSKPMGIDVRHIMELGGQDFINSIKPSAEPIIFDAGITQTDSRRQKLYENATGYMGAATVTFLAELELRKVQSVDKGAAADFRAEAERLASIPDQEFTVDMLPSELRLLP